MPDIIKKINLNDITYDIVDEGARNILNDNIEVGTLDIDTVPQSNSGNLITSGAVYTAVNNKQAKITVSGTQLIIE